MTFLALLIVILLVQYWGSGGPAHRDGAFQSWAAFWEKTGAPAGVRWALVVLCPALLAGLLIALLAPILWGVPALLLNVAALLYSLGRGDLIQQVEDYLHHWQEGDWQSAWQRAGQFVAVEQLDETADPAALHQFALRAVAYQGFERLFAVVFWFMLAGPGGALLYRLACLKARAANASSVDRQWMERLEWLPGRVLGFTFALVGNFNTAWHAVQDAWREPSCPTGRLVANAGLGALQWLPVTLPEDADDARRDAFIVQATCDIRAMMTLLARSAMVWLGLIAFWQLLRIW